MKFSRAQIALRAALYVAIAALPCLVTALTTPPVNWSATLASMTLAGAVAIRAYADTSSAKLPADPAPDAVTSTA